MSNHENKPQSVEWITPPWLLDALEWEFGKFDLDPCACGQHLHDRFTQYFTPEMNGLSQPWHGNVFMNPPYGNGVADWVTKASIETLSGSAFQVVCLLPARTDTQWWMPCRSAHEWMFIQGRVHFYRPDGTEGGAGAFPSVVVVFKRGNRYWGGPTMTHVSRDKLKEQFDGKS